jgi:hypothetical protein
MTPMRINNVRTRQLKLIIAKVIIKLTVTVLTEQEGKTVADPSGAELVLIRLEGP